MELTRGPEDDYELIKEKNIQKTKQAQVDVKYSILAWQRFPLKC